jgi:hypothetical protein
VVLRPSGRCRIRHKAANRAVFEDSRTNDLDQWVTDREAATMSVFNRSRRPVMLLTAAALTLTTAAIAPTAHAAGGDRDGDGMPNRWEDSHGLDADRANAAADADHDGLSNLSEYRRGGHPRLEDSDRDGHDDSDEVRDGDRRTRIDDRDSDDDGTRDGDEDSDRDGVDNEDEDDSTEPCAGDDDDRDRDFVADEDENDYGFRAGDGDSDDDGVRDGEEDSDDDGMSDEDDDDSDDDSCSDDDEDLDDLLGPIVSFDAETGELVVDTVRSGLVTFVVTEDTEVEYDSSGRGSGEEGDLDDLVAGAVVVEVDLEDDGTLEEVELARS